MTLGIWSELLNLTVAKMY